jgi:apolipoprotein N-acyltransferase
MRKVPLLLGVFLLIVALNWVRLDLTGQIPAGTNPLLVVMLTIIVLLVAMLLIWFGMPSVRQSYGSSDPGCAGTVNPA